MAAVFLLLQVRAELDEKIAFDLGKKLMEQYFPKDLQVTSLLSYLCMCTFINRPPHTLQVHVILVMWRVIKHLSIRDIMKFSRK